MVQINKTSSSGSASYQSIEEQIAKPEQKNNSEVTEVSQPKLSDAETSTRKAEIGFRGMSRQMELQKELATNQSGVTGVHYVGGPGQDSNVSIKATSSDQTGPGPIAPPDPFGAVSYKGVPTQDGRTDVRASHAVPINNWVKDVQQEVTKGPSRKAADDLQNSAEDFRNTEARLAGSIDKALERGVKNGAIGTLDNKTDGRVTKGLRDFQEWSIKAKHHYHGVKESSHKLVSAEQGLAEAESKLQKNELEKLQAQTKTEKEAIEARIQNRTGNMELAKKALGVAGDFARDPQGALLKYGPAKLEEAAMDILNDKDKQKIIDLSSKISAIDKQIEDVKGDEVKAGLNKAKAELEAAKIGLMRDKVALQGAKKMVHHAVDDLAATEKQNPGTTSVFGKMQTYYKEMSALGKDLQDLSQDYVTELQHGPISRATEISRRVADDQHTVSTRINPLNDKNRGAFEEFNRGAQAIGSYASKLELWRQNEIARQTTLQEELFQDNHLEFASTIFERVGQQGLGHTQDIRYQTR